MLDLHSKKKNVTKYPSPDPMRFYPIVTVSGGPTTACNITVGQLAIHAGLPTVTYMVDRDWSTHSHRRSRPSEDLNSKYLSSLCESKLS